MLSTTLCIAVCIVCVAAVAAVWDAARRYFEMRRFNQAALDRMADIEREHERLSTQVQAISGKLNMAIAPNANRLNRVGSR